MNGPATQRLFFALWPGPALRRQLTEALAGVGEGVRGRQVPSDRWHITLLFLGNVTTEARTELEAAADTVAMPGFELVLDRIGYWPRSRVAWYGPDAVPPGIMRLYQQLASKVAACHLPVETRPYAPHLTLIRDARAMPAATAVPAVHWPVRSFTLVASESGSKGPYYRVLRTWPLRPPEDAGSRC